MVNPMKTARSDGFFKPEDSDNREGRFAVALSKELDSRGQIVTRADFQIIRRAFNRHWKCCLHEFMEAEHKHRMSQ